MAAGTPTFLIGSGTGAVLDTDATLGPTSSITGGTTTLAAGDQLGMLKNGINTLINVEKALLYDLWTTTGATFTIPAAGSTVAVTIASAKWPLVGQFIEIGDGTHNMTGLISAVGATAGTAQTSITVRNVGLAFNDVSGTMATGSIVRCIDLSVPTQVWGSWPAGLLFCPSATLYGVFSSVNSIPYIALDDGTNNATSTVSFIGMVPWNAILQNGVTVRLKWTSATATTNAAVLGAAFERLGTATVVSDHFGTQVTATTTVGGTVSIFTNTAIALPYANMGSVAQGDWFRLQIQRLGSNGSDSLVGNANVFTVSIESAT